MFRHILLPTDGSPLSEAAAREGIRFAQRIGAQVTALHVIPEFHLVNYRAEELIEAREQYTAYSQAQARHYLSVISDAARLADVPCETLFTTSDHAYAEIIRVADANGCDVIVMASHGRRGVQALLMGSETQKVLTHSHIPVLVFR